MSNYRVLKAGRFRLSSDHVVEVTPETLVAMAAHTPLPMPIVVRHDAGKICGQVTRFFVTDDGTELWATVKDLALVPAFAVEPPEIFEVSVTGAPGWEAVRERDEDPRG